MKIIVAHPGQQHSLRTAYALYKWGGLHKYLTTVYNKKGSITSLLNPVFSHKNAIKASRRKNSDIPANYIKQYLELPALFTIALSRFPRLVKLKDWWNFKVAQHFNQKAIRYAKDQNIDGIIVYDGISCRQLKQFKQKSPNKTAIMDFSIASRPYMRKIYEEDMKQFQHTNFYTEDPVLWNDKIIRNILSDIASADYFLAASNFVKKSLIYCGVDEAKIKILPYGVDIKQFRKVDKITRNDNILRLLFIGQVNRRKGLHHILEIISKMPDVEIDIVGGIDPHADIYKRYAGFNNIHFKGFVDHNDLYSLYCASDVFVLPSLAEGMSLAGLEALASGMPLLCSDNSGVNDLVVNGLNGYVFRTGDLKDLTEKITWFKAHRDQCAQMGSESRRIAEKHSWEEYNVQFAKIMDEISANLTDEKNEEDNSLRPYRQS